LIFDFDGLLVDTEAAALWAWQEAFREHDAGLAGGEDERCECWWGLLDGVEPFVAGGGGDGGSKSWVRAKAWMSTVAGGAPSGGKGPIRSATVGR
jgi:phosphoglycolate phosphatase-like HAD superfamily hydrolase